MSRLYVAPLANTLTRHDLASSFRLLFPSLAP